MSQRPTGWVDAPFGVITSEPTQRVPEHAEEFTYIDIASVDRESKRILSPQRLVGAKAPSRARKVVRAGDVLVSMTRPNLNAVALVPPELDGQIASTGFDVLRPVLVDPRWLFGIVRSRAFIEAMSGLVQGALYPAVRSSDIRGYVAPVAPLGEQHRIAIKLEAVLAKIDACRERLDRVPAILKKFRETVLEAAVSGELTQEWRAGRGTAEWSDVPVQGVCVEVFDGPFGSHLKTADYSESGIRVIRLENIGHLSFLSDRETYITTQKYRTLTKHTLMPGDILFSSFVDQEVRVCTVPDNVGTAINKADCFCLRVNEGKALPSFVKYRLAATRTYREIRELVHGATRPRVNLSQIRGYTISLPNIDEQREIVRRVDELFALADSLAARYQAGVARVAKITPAVLAKAFRGELVPQDPHDEPAEMLLERIRAERHSEAIRPGTRKVRGRAKSAAPIEHVPRRRSPLAPH